MPESIPYNPTVQQGSMRDASAAMREGLKHNPHAACSYLALRRGYARDIIAARVSQVAGESVAESTASADARRAVRAARALLIGLAVQADYSKTAAEEGAYLITDVDFTPEALIVPPTSELRRVYVAQAPADDHTRTVAPERVLYAGQDRTAYLFSEVDARLFQERTGHDLTAL